MTKEEAEREMQPRRSLPRDAQVRITLEAAWTLSGWLYLLAPKERQWHWWDASIDASDQISVTIEVEDWPHSLEEVRWLFRASGAVSFEEVE